MQQNQDNSLDPEIRSLQGRQSPTYVRTEHGYGRAESGFHKEPQLIYPEMNHRRRESLGNDLRFLQGTTTTSAFKEAQPEVFRRYLKSYFQYKYFYFVINAYYFSSTLSMFDS